MQLNAFTGFVFFLNENFYFYFQLNIKIISVFHLKEEKKICKCKLAHRVLTNENNALSCPTIQQETTF